MSNQSSNRPTHRVYAVTKKGREAKGFWTEIGAAWAHTDGKGFKIRLNLLPLDPNAEIVVREPQAEGQDGAQ